MGKVLIWARIEKINKETKKKLSPMFKNILLVVFSLKFDDGSGLIMKGGRRSRRNERWINARFEGATLLPRTVCLPVCQTVSFFLLAYPGYIDLPGWLSAALMPLSLFLCVSLTLTPRSIVCVMFFFSCSSSVTDPFSYFLLPASPFPPHLSFYLVVSSLAPIALVLYDYFYYDYY